MHRIAAENLAIWREAAADNRELRLLQLQELARSVAHTLSPDTELTPSSMKLPFDPTPENGFTRAMRIDEQISFCRELLDAHPALVQEGDMLTAPPASPRIACLAGSMFSKAWERFSPLLPNARPVYFSSLAELLEETAAGEADFTLLPIEDAKGARFLHFYEELERLELHITHTCDIPSEEGEHSIRFALLSRLYRPTVQLPALPLWEYRIPGDDPHTLHELLTAADAAGLTLFRIDSLPALYPENSFSYYAVLGVPQSTPTWMDAYLSLFQPRTTVVGRYLHLKGEEA